MTIPSLLALESNDNQVESAILVVYKDGVTVELGNPLPTPIGGGNAVDAKGSEADDRSKIAFFRGDIYVAVDSSLSNRGGIFKTSDYGQSWVQVLDMTTQFGGGSPTSLHLHVINIQGVETLCFVAWYTDAGIAKSTDGVTWDSTTWDPGGTSSMLGNDMVIGTTLWLLPQNSTSANFGGRQYFTFDFDSPEVAEFTRNDGINDSDSCSAWCYFNDDVYLARPDARGSSTTVNIWRLIPTGLGTEVTSGSTSEIVATITHTAGDVGNNNIKWDMFTDGTNMYLFHFHNNTTSGDAWLCHQISSTFVVTELTSTVLPSYMADTPISTVSFGTSSGIVRVLTDQVTDPTNPRYYIYVNVNTTGQGLGGIPAMIVPWRIYQWQGNATEMTYLDEGGSVMDAINFGRTKTTDQGPFFGTRFFDIVTPSISITDRDYLSTGQVRIYYSVDFTSSHTAGIFSAQTISIIGLYASVSDGDFSSNQATLTATSNGTLMGNQVTGIIVNNGTYFVDWDYTTDGIAVDEIYSFRLVASNE